MKNSEEHACPKKNSCNGTREAQSAQLNKLREFNKSNSQLAKIAVKKENKLLQKQLHATQVLQME